MHVWKKRTWKKEPVYHARVNHAYAEKKKPSIMPARYHVDLRGIPSTIPEAAKVFSDTDSAETQRRVDFELLHRNTVRIVYEFGITG